VTPERAGQGIEPCPREVHVVEREQIPAVVNEPAVVAVMPEREEPDLAEAVGHPARLPRPDVDLDVVVEHFREADAVQQRQDGGTAEAVEYQCARTGQAGCRAEDREHGVERAHKVRSGTENASGLRPGGQGPMGDGCPAAAVGPDLDEVRDGFRRVGCSAASAPHVQGAEPASACFCGLGEAGADADEVESLGRLKSGTEPAITHERGHPGCREEAQHEGSNGPGGPGGVGHGPVGNAADANRVT